MTDKTWKATERTVARLLGGRRVPITGRQRGDAPDVDHETLSIEVKHRKNIPAWLLDAMDQAIQSATGGKTPVVVIHKKGEKHKNNLVVFRLSDLIEED